MTGKTQKLKLVAKALMKKHPNMGVSVGFDPDFIKACESIPTGSLSLDIASCIGGFPKGRIVEIYGPESSGKTTLALHAIAEAQALGMTAAFIDAEHALDPPYARNLNVNMDELVIVQPDTGEEALEAADVFVKSGEVDIVVIDSVAAMVPKAELDAPMDKDSIGLQARLMSKALRKLTGVVANTGTCLIFINQIRMKIGMLYGNPEVTSGGGALKFYASMRLRVSSNGKQDGERRPTKVKIVKNKVGIPFREAFFDIVYGQGIDRDSEIIDIALDCGAIDKAGSWYKYNDKNIGQGKHNAIDWLNEHKDIKQDVIDMIYASTAIVTK